jgi:hypothetical protein
VKKIEEEINNEIVRIIERQPTKKRPNVLTNAISVFFAIKEPFNKDDVQQKDFLQDLGLLIVKNNLPLQFVENVWFKHLILHLSFKVVFPSRKQFSKEILLNFVEKTKQVYVLPKLTNCIFATTSFDLWMSKGVHDIFTFVINFLGCDWQPKQVTIGLFEAIKITKQSLVNNLTKLFDQYGLENKIIAYVKDEGSNLNTMTIASKSVVKCEVLGLDESFQGVCFGHTFSKAYQYATTNEKVCRNFKFLLIKYA